eukprot:TRINITY_DN59971_c0_g1_i1.p1 TRINITY_DN59971_c0_g1~~TRINITY_DN59971_c0_g1_i1.p1  ORF type:complete len:367 (-),score=4.04 TRINITY_DN59971_c0_g1_i1:183-1283(-)
MAATCSVPTAQSFRLASPAVERVSNAVQAVAVKNALVGKAVQARFSKTSTVAAASFQTPTGAVARRVKCAAADDAAPAAPTRPSAAQLAQTVVELSLEGTLVTIAHGGSHDGESLPATWPLSSHAFFALDPEGRPIVLLKDGSRAAGSLVEDSQACLHVQVELPGQQKPQCALHGRLAKAADDQTVKKLEAAWRRRFPDDDGDDGALSGEGLYLLDVQRVLVAADVTQEGDWISAEDFLAAEPDPLREVAAGIVADFNREHWQDLRRFPQAFAGMDVHVEDASMTWVDRLGFDLRVLARPATRSLAAAADLPTRVMELRVPFPREVGEEREARSAITMMAQVAWEKERSFAPINVAAVVEAPAGSS